NRISNRRSNTSPDKDERHASLISRQAARLVAQARDRMGRETPLESSLPRDFTIGAAICLPAANPSQHNSAMKSTPFASLLLAYLFLGIVEAESGTNTVALRAGHLLDVVTGKMLEKQVILVAGDTLQSVSAEGTVAIPTGAEVIDLGQAWVLPGLIDCHTHITSQIEDYYADTFRKSPIDYAVEAHVYARRTLEAGFTTCRDVAAAEFIDVALKRAIASGKVVGPRLFVAGNALSVTGGHGDLSGFSPYLHIDNFNGVVDGVDEIRKKIRWQVKNGVDLTKFCATAGVL